MLAVAIFVCISWILSVCIHEFGHAVVAYWGGDTSVKDKGYLTLNPLKYTDFNLSLILPIIFLLIGGIPLPGAAVYIDQQRLRNRWWQSAVAAAGPLASIIVTLLLVILFRFSLALLHSKFWWIYPALAFLIFLQIYVIIINSLPIPSLDGYGVIEPWLPRKIQKQLAKYSGSGFIVLFILILFFKPVNLLFSKFSDKIAQFVGVPSAAIAAGFDLFNKYSVVVLVAAIGVILLIRKIERELYDVHYKRGNVLSKSRQYEKAIAAYDKAIKIRPNQYELWDKRGRLLLILNRYEEAIASCDRAIQIEPDYALAWYNKACCYIKQNSVDLAIETLKQAINLEPKKTREYAKNDSSFDVIRENEFFKKLICPDMYSNQN